MEIIKKLFRRNVEPEFDAEAERENLLLSLPRCTKHVVIVSPLYGEKHYDCEIIISAEDLFVWAECHAQSVRSSRNKEQIAREVLPVWLSRADLNNDAPSCVSGEMYNVLRPYVLDFIDKGQAVIYCPSCQSFLTEVQMEKRNDSRAAGWSYWTDVWICSCGHQLCHEEHEMHVHINPVSRGEGE